MSLSPEPALVARFAADLDALSLAGVKLGVAVSGGPDSLALLLLAAAARPGLVEAATVDHRLRPESAAEAETVAQLCGQMGIPHATLPIEWSKPPSTNLQARARSERYRALGEWAIGRKLAAVATGHHLDDQAETLLMRLARGAGVGGLAGVRSRRPLVRNEQHTVALVRPLLDWSRAELGGVVASAGLTPVEDPANSDERHERTRARAFLAQDDWPEPARLAASAANLADAEEALQFVAASLFRDRHRDDGETLAVDANGLPRELKRRLLLIALLNRGAPPPRGPELMRLMRVLERGGTATLGGVKVVGGARWRLSKAPARRGRED